MYVYSNSIILLTQLDVRRLSLMGKLCFRGGVETTITAAMKKVNRGPLVTSGLTFTSSRQNHRFLTSMDVTNLSIKPANVTEEKIPQEMDEDETKYVRFSMRH